MSALGGAINPFVVIPAVSGLLFIWGFCTRRLLAYTLFIVLGAIPSVRTVIEAMIMGDMTGVIAGEFQSLLWLTPGMCVHRFSLISV